MSSNMGGLRPRLNFPEATSITVVVVITAVLVLRGLKPVEAVLLIGGAGLVGATVVRLCVAGALTALLRPATAVLQTPATI
ncbi:hypothetical protein GCM10010406_41160 [Streptomyces thermolineatus]|uniref:Uncharacterized protein n=1 Tax=Streptomyces thermolineatus TaxID=44033 RepID=A0ABP5ZKP4_9ACTN